MKSLIIRLLGRNALGSKIADGGDLEIVADLRAHINREVAGGYYDEDTILTSAIEVFADEMEASRLRSTAQNLLRSALLDQRVAQLDWPPLTDCDRLDAAFAQLETDGIVARQNFSCCGTCGSAEIWDEIAACETNGMAARGYAFFHVQDTESAVDGDGLYLNYGAVEEGEEAALKIGHEIVAELEAHDLPTEWNGDWSKRIRITLDWKRRR